MPIAEAASSGRQRATRAGGDAPGAPRNRVGAEDRAFSPRARRLGVAYVCTTLPLVAAAGLLARSTDSYLVVFVLSSAVYTTPALTVTRVAVRRTSGAYRQSWKLWYAAIVSMYVTGTLMLVGAWSDWAAPPWVGTLAVLAIGGFLTTAVVRICRTRSGGRALSVDVAECVIAVLTVSAPAALVWGDRIIHAENAWFTIPSSLAAVAMVSGGYWAWLLYLRLGDSARTTEACGIALTVVGAFSSVLQAAQGVSDFRLPAVPLIALQGLSTAMLLLVPLLMPRVSRPGLGSLPPQLQVRGGGLSALATLVGLPSLLGATWLVADTRPWAVPFTTAALALLLVLGALRHLATVRETRRLYSQVEEAARQRRELLTAVMQRTDEDRHRVAAQLHEQAVSAYASFVSFIQASGTSLGDQSPLTAASSRVRDDLARHADSLRQLLLAIAPLDRGATTDGAAAARDGAEEGLPGLGALVRGYLDSLYGDRPAPLLRVSIAGRIVLDWTTETIALRIVQEALGNVHRHSHARNVDVMIDTVGDGVDVHVVDDGVGFDPEGTLFESGIAAMREFAALAGGTIEVASGPGLGTTVTAHLGQGPNDETAGYEDDDADYEIDEFEHGEYEFEEFEPEPETVPALRLVRGGRTD